MLSDLALTQALARAGLSAPVRFEEVTGSTQATAREMADDGAPEWTLVAAGHQMRGRGRLGREWLDEPGGSLLASIVLRPAGLDPEGGGLLPMLAGAAAASACQAVSDADVGCKWPNDLLVGERKVGGILMESKVDRGRFAYVVLGVGVNLGAVPTGLLEAAALGPGDAGELLARFLVSFQGGYRPSDTGFAVGVLEAYRPRCRTLGRLVRASAAGRLVHGRAFDLDRRGGLVVQTRSGPVTVAVGEVVHLDD